MKSLNANLPCDTLEQVFLLARDTNLLCRILGLYAARGVDVLRTDYVYAAQDVMTLKVSAACERDDTAEVLRVLVEKAASLVGVIAAAQQPVVSAQPRLPSPAS